MDNLSDEIYHTEDNKIISDKIQKNQNGIIKEKYAKILENTSTKTVDSENDETTKNLNIYENKSPESIINYNKSLFENLKRDGFPFLDYENAKTLHNILEDGFKFTDNAKSSQIDEKSINVKNEVDQKNLYLFPNILFLNNKNEEKINDFSEEKEIKEIKNDIKLFPKNVDTVKETKKNENIKKEVDVGEQGQNIENNDKNKNINEDINQNYLIKNCENFSFLEQPYSINNKQNQKQLINNSIINNNKNNLIQNEQEQSKNCQINSEIINENSFINNYKNFDNCNYLKDNIIQNNSINHNQILQSQYNDQFNNNQNPYIQNININNIIIQNLINQNIIFQNFNFQNINNFKNKHLKNSKKNMLIKII